MSDDRFVLDVFLQPGEYYFGDADTRIRTLLGSCVAIVMWHPRRRIGGMTHSLLPTGDRRPSAGEPDGRFVDEALMWLLREAVKENTDPTDYQIKFFGGSDMFTQMGVTNRVRIGEKNVARGAQIMQRLGLTVAAHDLGGGTHRNVILDVSSGDVWVRRGRSVSDSDGMEGIAA